MNKTGVFIFGMIIGILITFYKFANGDITLVSEHAKCERITSRELQEHKND